MKRMRIGIYVVSIFILFLYLPANSAEFCGWATSGACETDADCIKGGCSGQVCQAKSEEPVITTCEYSECYNSKAYGVDCGCVEGKCQWHMAVAQNTLTKEDKNMQIKSSSFEDNEIIPRKYTCDGADVSPPLTWTKPPTGTKSIALICDDPDAPMGTWVHWVLYGLSPETTSLPENVPSQREVLKGARQGINDFRKIGYGGPCPPKGPAHRYFFKVYALDIELNLPSGATKQDLEKAMKGHILAQGELMGKYGR